MSEMQWYWVPSQTGFHLIYQPSESEEERWPQYRVPTRTDGGIWFYQPAE